MTLEELLANKNLRKFFAAGETTAVKKWVDFHPEYQLMLNRFNQQLNALLVAAINRTLISTVMQYLFSIVKISDYLPRNTLIARFREQHPELCTFLEAQLPSLQKAADAFAKAPELRSSIIDSNETLKEMCMALQIAFQTENSLEVAITQNTSMEIAVKTKEGQLVTTYDINDSEFSAEIAHLIKLKAAMDDARQSFVSLRQPLLLASTSQTYCAHANTLKTNIKKHCLALLKLTEDWFANENNSLELFYNGQSYEVSAPLFAKLAGQNIIDLEEIIAHAALITQKMRPTNETRHRKMQ